MGALDALSGLASLLGSSVLVAELIVALVELLALLLQGLEVLVLLLKLLSETSKLTRLAGNGKLLRLLGIALSTLVIADLVLQTHHLEDHNVGAVKDERKEEGEAAKVHVALGVELAGLDFEALVAHNSGTAIRLVMCPPAMSWFFGVTYPPPCLDCSEAAASSSWTR